MIDDPLQPGKFLVFGFIFESLSIILKELYYFLLKVSQSFDIAPDPTSNK